MALLFHDTSSMKDWLHTIKVESYNVIAKIMENFGLAKRKKEFFFQTRKKNEKKDR